MASQYDEIGPGYSDLKKLVTSMVEEVNVRQTVQPYLAKMAHPRRILDLACGTGYYSKKAIDWGADYVLGIDQSQAMVEVARDCLISQDDPHQSKYGSKVRFEVGDALGQGRVAGEDPFDMVIGCWLLNYAANADELAKMFRTISANLKPGGGGVFVGLVPAAVEDVDDLAARWPRMQARQPADFPVRVRYYERLPSGEGWKTEVANTTASGETITFRNFRLKKSVYEEGARAAGIASAGKGLEWRDLTLPGPIKAQLDQLGWTAYFDGFRPDGRNIGILVVEKE